MLLVMNISNKHWDQQKHFQRNWAAEKYQYAKGKTNKEEKQNINLDPHLDKVRLLRVQGRLKKSILISVALILFLLVKNAQQQLW